MDTATPMDDSELIELEDEIAGESEHALKEDDFTFDISVCLNNFLDEHCLTEFAGGRSCYLQKII